MRLCVIPARGGSKRIPRKNIKPFCGRPMIAYAIEAARSSDLFSHIVVSTDDDEIAVIASKFGAEVPFRRPAELADDFASTADVIAHAIGNCHAEGWEFEMVCCIYPTVPLIETGDLRKSLTLNELSNANFTFPVAEFPSAIQRALKRDQAGNLFPFQPEHELTRTQDLEPAYFDAGQFYWGHREAWLSNARIHSNSAGLVIPSFRVIDIDTQEDWARAEILYKALHPKNRS